MSDAFAAPGAAAPYGVAPASAMPRVAAATVITVNPVPQGSRRPRIWDLPAHAHCPVVGVCLPMSLQRDLVARARSGEVPDEDYAVHVQVVNACRQRSPLAEAVQRALDERHARSVRGAAAVRDPASLCTWWGERVDGPELAGALWATLTHPRCTPSVAQRVLGDVHMLQHQAGAAVRVDRARHEQVVAELAALRAEHEALQRRHAAAAAESARRIEAAAVEHARLSAALAARDAQLERARRDAGAHETRARSELVASAAGAGLEALRDALDAERRETHRLQMRLARLRARARAHAAASGPGPHERASHDAASRLAGTAPPRDVAGPRRDGPSPRADCAVLCVGGRPSSVPVYRRLVERCGARFIHHDGGAEDRAARLEDTPRAADVVICQSGCVSHDAYWRVKEHCRRAGKRCVFVSVPSHTAMSRAIGEALGAPAADAVT